MNKKIEKFVDLVAKIEALEGNEDEEILEKTDELHDELYDIGETFTSEEDHYIQDLFTKDVENLTEEDELREYFRHKILLRSIKK